MTNKKVMKDISLNAPVSITLPAHTWIGFIAAYSSARWSNADAANIGSAAIDQLFDPVYVKEREAAMQAERDSAHSAIHSMFTGQPPEIPPNMIGGDAP